MLWDSEGHPIAVGPENKEATRKSKCPLCLQLSCTPSSPGWPILCFSSAPGLFWAGCAISAQATGTCQPWPDARLIPGPQRTSQSPTSTPLPTWPTSYKDLPFEPPWIPPTPGGPRGGLCPCLGNLLSAFPATCTQRRLSGQVCSLQSAFFICKWSS